VYLLSDDSLHKLKTAKCTGRDDASYEVFNYDILQNPSYLKMFGMSRPEKLEDFAKQSDITLAFYGDYTRKTDF
jgi:hypothetical protein